MAHKKLNGVDVDRLNETVENISKDNSLATFKFRAKNEWKDGAYSVSTIKSFYGTGQEDNSRKDEFHIEGDEPDVLLGGNKAPNANEAVLHALASCMTTTFIYHAAAQGIKVDEVELEMEGELDLRGFLALPTDKRNGFKGINMTFKVKSDAPEATLEDLFEHAQNHSPVLDLIENPVPVHACFEKIGGEASGSQQKAA